MDMNNTTSDKNVAQDIEFLKSNEADALYFRGNPKLKSAVESVLERNKELERKYLHEKLAKEEVEELLENSVPTQKIEDELKRLSVMLKKTMEGKIQEYTVEEIIISSNTVQELLEKANEYF